VLSIGSEGPKIKRNSARRAVMENTVCRGPFSPRRTLQRVRPRG